MDAARDGQPLGLASLQRELAIRHGLPPVERWNPGHCGEIDIRIARDGTWFHEGRPIARRELVRLFSTILRKDQGGFHLVTPVEKLRIRVEDAPFIASLLDVEGDGPAQRLIFTTNVGDQAVAGPDHAIRIEQGPSGPAPYLHVRGSLEARISRNVFYQLADLAVEGAGAFAGQLGVWSDGVFFSLGTPT